jgi:hypothetical protein
MQALSIFQVFSYDGRGPKLIGFFRKLFMLTECRQQE